MAFQDFDIINERRQQERRKKIRKRIVIGLVSTILLVSIVGAVAYAGLNSKSSDGGRGGGTKGKSLAKPSNKPLSSSSDSTSTSTSSAKSIEASSKMVKVICEAAEYKEKCEGSLGDAVKNDSSITQPKDLLRVSIKLAQDEVGKAIEKTSSLNFASDMDKGAYEDCKQLFDDAKEELGLSINEITTSDDLKKLSTKAPDLNNWLSAVISYHQTCIDGFPEGELKTKLKDLFKDSQEFVSNSLSIVTAASTVLSAVQSVITRHLLWEENGSAPHWISRDDRRILKAADDKPIPNVTVAKDGSGQFTTISEALAAIPEKYDGRYVVYVKEGIYEETVTVTKRMENMTMYGDGSQKSIITGSKNFVDGVRTFQTATFVVLGNGFLGKAMGFRNTAGAEKHQAVAARVQADRAIFVNCRFEGFQDTLYAQTHRQFYRSCVISGTVDFIFGDATAIFQNCIMAIRKPMDNQQNIVTANGRFDQKETTGFVLQKCEIKADDRLPPEPGKIKSYLGRPWKEYSRTIVMESDISDLISPDGWMPWDGDFGLNTLYYGEFNNTGPGGSTNARVNWLGHKILSKDEASKFTVGTFLEGAWISGRGVPAQLGMYN